ncbi:hypothetical protein FHR99_001411 [Litorivivens lipolytica]|uniref:Uncharacterized protein n=1 Tax=Litorivivens lipolytica TaxID=1524264 RepID=A0A7W4W4I3_9GAMM|nr:hypothetical protein [Litorivivens lipolytica]MBB3047175.1 hypothetical protein [Litorivivens lipolytica]
MFVKKTLVVSLLAASGAAVAQGPVGTGILPGGLGDSLPLGVNGQSSLETEPLTSAATPEGDAGVNFNVTEFLAGSIVAQTNSASLPGLGQQTAEFVQNQGGSGGGGTPPAPSAPSTPDGSSAPDGSAAPGAPSAPNDPTAMGGGMDEQSTPDAEGFVTAVSNAEPPSQSELENRVSAIETQVTSLPDTLAAAQQSSAPSAPSGSSAPSQPSAPSAPSAPDGGGNVEPTAPQQPDAPDGDGSSAPDSDGVNIAVGVPSDAEEQSPLPQPFQVSEIVNVTVSLQAESPSSGGGQAPSVPAAPSAPDEEPAAPAGPDDLPEA